MPKGIRHNLGMLEFALSGLINPAFFLGCPYYWILTSAKILQSEGHRVNIDLVYIPLSVPLVQSK